MISKLLASNQTYQLELQPDTTRLQDALLEHFDGKLQSLVRIADGTSGLSFIGNLDGQRRFFKTYSNESGRDSLLRECTILEMVSPQLEPHLIKLDQSAVSRVWLHTKVLDAAFAATPKEIIGLIHNYQVQLEKCDLTTVDLSRDPNITYLVTQAELALAELAEGNFLAASTIDVVRSSIDRLRTIIQSDNFQLCHGDLGPKNILRDGSTPIAIDWEDAFFGIPGYDYLYWLTFYENRKWLQPEYLKVTGLAIADEIAVMIVIVLLKSVISVRNGSHSRNALSINDRITEVFAIV